MKTIFKMKYDLIRSTVNLKTQLKKKKLITT